MRVSDKANIMCESYSKKTINSEHLEAALKDYGVVEHLKQLKDVEDAIKEINAQKKEQLMAIEQIMAKDSKDKEK